MLLMSCLQKELDKMPLNFCKIVLRSNNQVAKRRVFYAQITLSYMFTCSLVSAELKILKRLN